MQAWTSAQVVATERHAHKPAAFRLNRWVGFAAQSNAMSASTMQDPKALYPSGVSQAPSQAHECSARCRASTAVGAQRSIPLSGRQPAADESISHDVRTSPVEWKRSKHATTVAPNAHETTESAAAVRPLISEVSAYVERPETYQHANDGSGRRQARQFGPREHRERGRAGGPCPQSRRRPVPGADLALA